MFRYQLSHLGNTMEGACEGVQGMCGGESSRIQVSVSLRLSCSLMGDLQKSDSPPYARLSFVKLPIESHVNNQSW